MYRNVKGHSFKVLKSDSQKANQFRNAYNYAAMKGFYSLYDAYENPSEIKERIYKFWEGFCYEIGGKHVCIPTHNSMVFTFAFIKPDDETGVIELYYITKYENYVFEL